MLFDAGGRQDGPIIFSKELATLQTLGFLSHIVRFGGWTWHPPLADRTERRWWARRHVQRCSDHQVAQPSRRLHAFPMAIRCAHELTQASVLGSAPFVGADRQI